MIKNEIFGMMKTLLDAHTMGINAATSLLQECGYKVVITTYEVEKALERLNIETNQEIVIKWIKNNNINNVGFSYRLDTKNAIEILGRLIYVLKKNDLYECESAIVKNVFFAGLSNTCDLIEKEYFGRIKTFRGGESPLETLKIMGIKENIPYHIVSGCKYDKELLEFGKEIINQEDYKNIRPLERIMYPEYGLRKDTLIKRLDNNFSLGFSPLIRAHLGPYSSNLSRIECLIQYNQWCKSIAESGFLDILSIGSSQLSQSNFGEDWDGKINGGGVPVNSEKEYRDIWDAARPMLVRTYSSTKNIKNMVDVYEKNINNAWHALSLWWFNELDGRGPNTLYDNLKEHIEAMEYIAKLGKPVETNVPHHFAFRGCDDVTYIVSAYISARMAKKCGIKNFILQNMLNTPRSTWGIQDLAKSRALINIVKTLQDKNFRVILQTRAGLDYFKPEIESAKIQLAAVTAMMDDIDPDNVYSPEIIHVVSYSEALYLATPDVLNESIKITRKSLEEYRKRKRKGETPCVDTDDIKQRTYLLEKKSKIIIKAMENNIDNLYSPEGLYIAFVAGWLPVPELWSNSDEFLCAKDWSTSVRNGGVELVDKNIIIPVENRINKCINNLLYVKYWLKKNNKYKLDSILL